MKKNKLYSGILFACSYIISTGIFYAVISPKTSMEWFWMGFWGAICSIALYLLLMTGLALIVELLMSMLKSQEFTASHIGPGSQILAVNISGDPGNPGYFYFPNETERALFMDHFESLGIDDFEPQNLYYYSAEEAIQELDDYMMDMEESDEEHRKHCPDCQAAFEEEQKNSSNDSKPLDGSVDTGKSDLS